MTRLQRRRMFRVIQGGKRDEADLIGMAFAPWLFWIEIWGQAWVGH